MGKPITFEPKQESEEVELTFDFSNQLGDGETISAPIDTTAAIVGDLSSATNITLSSVLFDTTKVRVLAAAGTHGERYLVTCQVAGTRQPVLELEAYLPVRNSP